MASYEFLTDKQSNYGWGKTWSANGRYPMIAKRSFRTLEDAQAFIDDTSLSGTACKGLILSVFADPKASNNGIYYVEKIKANDTDTPGILVKAGSGTGSITAENYSAAKELATADNIGQIIFVLNDETSTTELAPESTEDNPVYVVYTAGPYIVTGASAVAKLGTTSASGDIAGDVETLKGKVGDLESTVSTISSNLAELKVKDIQVNGSSIATDGIVAIDSEFVDESTSTNPITHAAIAAKIKGLAEQISEIPKFDIEVVEELPTEGISDSTVYLVVSSTEGVVADGENLYTEFIYVNNKWEKLGEQRLDLSGYLTSSDAESTYVKKTDISSYDFAQIATNKEAIEGINTAITGEGGYADRIEATEGEIDTLQAETVIAGAGDDYINAEVGENRTLNVTATIGDFEKNTEGLATMSAVKNYVESSLEWIDVVE